MGNTNNKLKQCKRCKRPLDNTPSLPKVGNNKYCLKRDCYNNAGYSKKAIEWLDSISKKIQHAERGGEKEILIVAPLRNGKTKVYTFKVDGYYKGTVYEFYGDYFHGNPKVYKSNDIGPNGKTFGELYEKTQWREQLLRNKYNVIIMWEKDYDNKLKKL